MKVGHNNELNDFQDSPIARFTPKFCIHLKIRIYNIWMAFHMGEWEAYRFHNLCGIASYKLWNISDFTNH